MINNPASSPESPKPARARNRRVGWTIRMSPGGFVVLVVLDLVVLAAIAFGINWLFNLPDLPRLLFYPPPTATVVTLTPTSTITPSLTPTQEPTASPTITRTPTQTPLPPTDTPVPVSTLSLTQGLIILALDEGGDTHLFAYQPEENGSGQPLPLTRLTYGPWDDITPAISPDGKTVAFASNRGGYWDIYLLDVASAGVTRLTDTLAYEAAPAWSPDNQWLVYEAYVNDNLEIMLQSISNPADSIQLTNNLCADFSPSWSAGGRQLAFVSDCSGDNEIYVANLDASDDQRYQNISLNPGSSDTHPAWSPLGTSLVWAGEQEGMHNLSVVDINPSGNVDGSLAVQNWRNLGSGDWPIWSADGQTILSLLQAPNQTYLTAYPASYPGLALPILAFPGEIYGFSWGMTSLLESLPTDYQQAAQITPTPLFGTALSLLPEENGGRYQLANLAGVDAPQAYLNDAVDESFQALHDRSSGEAGWDFMATLENAYVPLTSPLEPGMVNDWLYTGRAFTINTLPLNAGWLVVIREDFGTQTYWRVYIRAFNQDGSSGLPLHQLAWDFSARASGDVSAYEQGGRQLTSVPPGYWIDFTALARAYGWERLPALNTWRAALPAARFNEFAYTEGMSWQAAMLQLYPPEALVTPTPLLPPTPTLTPTPRWYVAPTATATPAGP